MQRKPTATRRAELVDVAMRILATRGARRLTAQALAAEIGVTPGAIFRHFRSMDAIVDAIVDRGEAMLAADYPSGVADPLDRLHQFFRRRVRTVLAHPPLARLLLSDQLAQAGGLRPARRVEAFKARTRRFVLACLREADRRGRLRAGVRPEVGLLLVVGAVLALAHANTAGLEGRRAEALAERVWAALAEGLAGR
jgi:AcrR family transcriptional regulator